MTRAVKTYRLMLRAQPAAFLARGMTDVLETTIRRAPTSGELHDHRWPAHLHINVEPAARGTGAASGLMHRWFDRLREADSPCCHLQTLCENTRAVRFSNAWGLSSMARRRWSPDCDSTANGCTSRPWCGVSDRLVG